MRWVACAALVVTGLLTLAMFTPASALLAKPLRVDVPFEFAAGNTTPPPGRYTVERNLLPLLLSVRSVDQKARATVLTWGLRADRPATGGRVVFRRHGYRRLLAEVWGGGVSSGRGVAPSVFERQTARRGSDVVRVGFRPRKSRINPHP